MSTEKWRQLERWIAQGGRALILADHNWPERFAGMPMVATGFGAVIGHIRTPPHPVAAELPPAALRYWLGAAGTVYSPPVGQHIPEMLIASHTLRRPSHGAVLTIIDGAIGGWPVTTRNDLFGLTQALMLEVRWGLGRAIVSTLLLAEGVSTNEPAACWLLWWAVDYLSDPNQWVGPARTGPIMTIGLPPLPSLTCWQTTEHLN
ncbi:MAG: hypothetical protein NZ899_15330, partial [Thermoguttaceae bacterium]|nr:hypothetical protein [Thermoguttaceae bacterium]